MKKIALLFVAAVMIAGGANAQSSCCKKGGHCTKACTKDSKSATTKDGAASKATKMEAPKKTS